MIKSFYSHLVTALEIGYCFTAVLLTALIGLIFGFEAFCISSFILGFIAWMWGNIFKEPNPPYYD